MCSPGRMIGHGFGPAVQDQAECRIIRFRAAKMYLDSILGLLHGCGMWRGGYRLRHTMPAIPLFPTILCFHSRNIPSNIPSQSVLNDSPSNCSVSGRNGCANRSACCEVSEIIGLIPAMTRMSVRCVSLLAALPAVFARSRH